MSLGRSALFDQSPGAVFVAGGICAVAGYAEKPKAAELSGNAHVIQELSFVSPVFLDLNEQLQMTAVSD
jgi:hypothetical protein